MDQDFPLALVRTRFFTILSKVFVINDRNTIGGKIKKGLKKTDWMVNCQAA